MKIDKFEDIIAWRKAGALTFDLYSQFKSSKDFSFRDQICRASVSIMNNIAEGFERNTDKELRQFLYIAKGSCAEVRSMLYIAFKLNYITSPEFKSNYALTVEISKLISGFVKALRL